MDILTFAINRITVYHLNHWINQEGSFSWELNICGVTPSILTNTKHGVKSSRLDMPVMHFVVQYFIQYYQKKLISKSSVKEVLNLNVTHYEKICVFKALELPGNKYTYIKTYSHYYFVRLQICNIMLSIKKSIHSN